jgi:hypothetical protein
MSRCTGWKKPPGSATRGAARKPQWPRRAPRPLPAPGPTPGAARTGHQPAARQAAEGHPRRRASVLPSMMVVPGRQRGTSYWQVTKPRYSPFCCHYLSATDPSCQVPAAWLLPARQSRVAPSSAAGNKRTIRCSCGGRRTHRSPCTAPRSGLAVGRIRSVPFLQWWPGAGCT